MASRIVGKMINNEAYGRYANNNLLNPIYGGQHGWAPNLTQWINNQAYVSRNVICILLEAPKFFDLMPEPNKWVATLKSLVELHAKSIEGLNAKVEVAYESHPVGGGGEVQHEYTNVTRTPSEPVFGFTEKYGTPIQNFIYHWITYGLMDPETKFALASTTDTFKTKATPKETTWLADWYSASMLFFEPDPTHTKVVRSWVITNMFPKDTGEIVGRRNLTEAGKMTDLSIGFTGLAQYNLGTNAFAQRVLDSISITNANPYFRKSFINDYEGAGINNQTGGADEDTDARIHSEDVKDSYDESVYRVFDDALEPNIKGTAEATDGTRANSR